MKLIVLGAGIAGVSTAWYLASEGHDVTVIDRADDVAMEPALPMPGSSLTATPRLGRLRVFRSRP